MPLTFLGRVRGEQEGRPQAPAWWWSAEPVVLAALPASPAAVRHAIEPMRRAPEPLAEAPLPAPWPQLDLLDAGARAGALGVSDEVLATPSGRSSCY